jgi:hypothetical protein
MYHPYLQMLLSCELELPPHVLCFNQLIHTYFNIDKYWLANYSLVMFIPDDEPNCARNMSK